VRRSNGLRKGIGWPYSATVRMASPLVWAYRFDVSGRHGDRQAMGGYIRVVLRAQEEECHSASAGEELAQISNSTPISMILS
jgi:hypothetical protein